MQQVEVSRDVLLKAIRIQTSKMAMQQEHSSKFWELLSLESLLKDLYIKDDV